MASVAPPSAPSMGYPMTTQPLVSPGLASLDQSSNAPTATGTKPTATGFDLSQLQANTANPPSTNTTGMDASGIPPELQALFTNQQTAGQTDTSALTTTSPDMGQFAPSDPSMQTMGMDPNMQSGQSFDQQALMDQLNQAAAQQAYAPYAPQGGIASQGGSTAQTAATGTVGMG